MCLIVIAASAMSAITTIATMTARIICLDAGTGGATTLREYAVLAVGRMRCALRASSSCQRGRACPSRAEAHRPNVAGASRAWLREAGERSRTRAAMRAWQPCRGEATRSGRAVDCAGLPGGPDAWLLRPRGVREPLEARAGAVLPRGRRLRGAAPRRRPRPGGQPHAGAVARRGRLVGPVVQLAAGSRTVLVVRALRQPQERGSARGAALAPRPGGAEPSRCWAAESARSERESAAWGQIPWLGGRWRPARA